MKVKWEIAGWEVRWSATDGQQVMGWTRWGEWPQAERAERAMEMK
jgi:hypothetical protein